MTSFERDKTLSGLMTQLDYQVACPPVIRWAKVACAPHLIVWVHGPFPLGDRVSIKWSKDRRTLCVHQRVHQTCINSN